MSRRTETRQSRVSRWAVKVGVLAGLVGVVLTFHVYAVLLHEDPAAGDTPGALYLFGTMFNSFIMGVFFFLAVWGLTHLVVWSVRKAISSKT